MPGTEGHSRLLAHQMLQITRRVEMNSTIVSLMSHLWGLLTADSAVCNPASTPTSVMGRRACMSNMYKSSLQLLPGVKKGKKSPVWWRSRLSFCWQCLCQKLARLSRLISAELLQKSRVVFSLRKWFLSDEILRLYWMIFWRAFSTGLSPGCTTCICLVVSCFML